jgi:hypothetical protein
LGYFQISAFKSPEQYSRARHLKGRRDVNDKKDVANANHSQLTAIVPPNTIQPQTVLQMSEIDSPGSAPNGLFQNQHQHQTTLETFVAVRTVPFLLDTTGDLCQSLSELRGLMKVPWRMKSVPAAPGYVPPLFDPDFALFCRCFLCLPLRSDESSR